MKVALVHDYLNQYGGGERVLEVLMEMFPDAPVFTILHDAKKSGGRFVDRVKGKNIVGVQVPRDIFPLFLSLFSLVAGSLSL